MHSKLNIDHRFSVAPMLDWTDRHCRFFLRLLSKQAVLYTEMVTTGAIIYGKGDYLSFNKEEHPVVLQLGGSDPTDMARCAKIAQEKGYDEININVGCPSDRVKNGSFGACLMSTPSIVADCLSAMQKEVDIPVTIKCRIGIDDMDDDKGLSDFILPIKDAGCEHFIVHARKAWLQGLSPKQNRDVPPLNYSRVYRLKDDNPNLFISINGGINSLEEAQCHLEYVDGVMLGREIYANPFILNDVDNHIFKTHHPKPRTRLDIIEDMTAYIHQEHAKGTRVWHIARHILGLFQGQIGGKIWRRYLSQNGTGKHNNPNLLLDAYEQVSIAQHKAENFKLKTG
ncbi:tRNA dihydrouridine(20/20a) synthase DusA [Glaciecola petra]|uniref:tRNA-dihydrouridine(20/20a) synthase n=1 Tax=Glaciecola petra TaxID=3075602 RepID=A0ABU2ZV55_9ALTE|nr:tRNA dihydrouridine(20/20a) synthase DusA [Aestuariibacter sp. P117]MDT0596518.1 tRNA dihydrouridine(20/20a) synthase DusA [Aestuariibacter sp. P117]